MSEDLGPIERALEQLEAAVVEEYDQQKLAAAANPSQRVQLPEEKLDQFAHELRRLHDSLYATGEVKILRLVSEHHDTLRIRMIYLQHLLEREIPRPYVEEALQEFSHAPRYGAQGRLPSAGTAAKPSLIGRLFHRSEPTGAKTGQVSRPAASGNDMRLIYLHKLMEEDRLNLLRESEKPPRVSHEIHTPAYIARFAARDFAEAHLGVRVSRPAEKIARTPEELRAKLAQREGQQEKDPR